MENIKLVTNNILRDATISFTYGSPSTAYPASRLYDGDRNDLWMRTQGGAAPWTIALSNFGTGVPIDFFAISRHNLASETVTISDGSGHQLYSSSIPDSSEFVASWSTPLMYGDEYPTSYQLTFTPKSDPYIAELTLGTKVFDVHPDFPGPVPTREPNQDIRYTRSGHRWGLKRGESKWAYEYKFTMGSTKMDVFKQCLVDTDDGLLPFYMYDHDGTLRYVELLGPASFPYVIPGGTSPSGDLLPYYQTFTMSVREVF